MEYEIGGFSVVDAMSLLIESLYVKSFDCNSDLKGGEFKSANHRISVFHLCILAFLLSDYIIPEKRMIFKCAKMSQVQVPKVRKRLQKTKGQNFCPKKLKKPCKTRLFGIGCIFDL